MAKALILYLCLAALALEACAQTFAVPSGCQYTTEAQLDPTLWPVAIGDTIIGIHITSTPYWATFNPVTSDTSGIAAGLVPDIVGANQWPYQPPAWIEKVPYWGIKCPQDSVAKFSFDPRRFNAEGLPIVHLVVDTASLFGLYGIYNEGEGFITPDAFVEVILSNNVLVNDSVYLSGISGNSINFSPGLPVTLVAHSITGIGKAYVGTDTLDIKIFYFNFPCTVGMVIANPRQTPNFSGGNDYITDVLGYPRNRIEKPAFVSMFNEDKEEVYSQNESIAISGNWGASYAQKGFQLFFRNEKMEYPWFGKKHTNKFKRLNLRCGGSGAWHNRFNHTIANRLAINTGLFAVADRPVHVFINGEYWGIYGVEERLNEQHYQAYQGVNSDSIGAMQYHMEGGAVEKEDLFGSYFGGSALVNWYQTNILSIINDPIELAKYIDRQDFFDYIFHNTYLRNSDWLVNMGNMVAMVDTINKKIDHLLVDQDHTFSIHNQIEPYDSMLQGNLSVDMASIMQTFTSDSLGINLHLNRACDLINTTYSTESILKHTQSVFDDYYPFITTYNEERWGPHCADAGYLLQQIQQIEGFAQLRPHTFLGMLMNHWGSIATDTFKVTVNVPQDTLLGGTFTVPQGWVKWSTLVLDTSFTGIYFAGVPIKVQAVAAPGFSFSHWLETGTTLASLVVNLQSDASFTPVFVPNTPIAVSSDSVIINEIMVKGDDWVELYNLSSSAINLGNLYLSDSLSELYALPDTLIQPGQYLVLETEPLGFKLDKDGEQVYLVSSLFMVLDSVDWLNDEIGDGSKGRSCENQWQLYDVPTPGSKNDSCLTGVFANDYNTHLNVYPNPSTGMIRITGLLEGEEWKLLTLTGLLISEGREATIDLATQPNGVYVLWVGNNAIKVVRQGE